MGNVCPEIFSAYICRIIMNRKKITKIAIIAGVSVAVLCVLIFLGIKHLSGDSVYIAGYVIVKTEGIDGRGKAEAVLDEVGLYGALAGTKATEEDKSRYKNFVDSVSFTLDKQDKLSNGDEIVLSITYDKTEADKLGIKTADNDRRIKVAGLSEGTLLDAFAEIKIITGGISPYIYVTYSNESENEYLASLEYSISKTSGLAIGDKIVIKCLADEKNAADKGFYFDTMEMEYTISEADKYIDKPELMDVSVIKELSEENIETIKTETEDTTSHMSYEVTKDTGYLYRDNNESAKDISFVKAVLAYNSSGFEREHENYILLFYRGDIVIPTYTDSDDPYEYIEGYFCFMYSDAVITRDGEFSMATNDPVLRYVCGKSYEEALSDAEAEMGSGYELTDIPVD